MEFYVVVLIFISCMIVLALLIYYCQERRNPEYCIDEKQRNISSIALSIGAPGLIDTQNGKSSMYSQNPAPIGFDRFYKQKMEKQNRARNSSNYNNNSLDDPSDSDTSNSEKIYFGPKTIAYTVARRMSESNSPKKSSSPAVVCHLGENKSLNGSPDCKIMINKGPDNDDESLGEASAMLKKQTENNEQIRKDTVVKNDEIIEERNAEELSPTKISSDTKMEDISVDKKLLQVPPFNPTYKIKRKNNSSSSLNIVEEEKE